MMKLGYGFKMIAEGDYACFTRPEQKIERVSYDVPTPGALEGMIKCIYWKPAIRYVIDRIIVFNPIEFENIRRNEVKEKISFSKVKSAMQGGESPEIYTKENISQRAGMVLKNVRYGIEFHFELTGIKSDSEDEGEEKHYNILLRRLRNGQCFKQPVFGCREFSVKKLELAEKFPMDEISPLLAGDRDLGIMLYGMKFRDGGIPVNGKFSDAADAVYYHPHLIDGVINVAEYRRDTLC